MAATAEKLEKLQSIDCLPTRTRPKRIVAAVAVLSEEQFGIGYPLVENNYQEVVMVGADMLAEELLNMDYLLKSIDCY